MNNSGLINILKGRNAIMGWESEKCIDFYHGEYKSGIFSKKSTIRLGIYPSQLEGTGFLLEKQVKKRHFLLNTMLSL